MVKCSIYQCNECKKVFPAKWFVGGYDGPFIIERYYDEHNMDRQKCPECKSNNLSFLGKSHIKRKQMKKLVTNFGDEYAKRLFWFDCPKPNVFNSDDLLRSSLKDLFNLTFGDLGRKGE